MRRYRTELGLTQEDLAQRAGVAVRTVGDLERGRTATPHRSSIDRIGAVLRLTPDSVRYFAEQLRRSDSDTADGTPSVGVTPVSQRPAQLPPDVPNFVGRANEIATLQRTIGSDGPGSRSAVAAVHGAGGIGKTALAVHVAHSCVELFPDGQLFAELSGSHGPPADPLRIVHGFLRSLGVDPTALPERLSDSSALMRSCLSERRVLLLLDDAADSAQVRPLLPAGSGCAVLVTSRSAVTLIDATHSLAVQPLPADAAHTLLAGALGAVRVQDSASAVDDIVRLCSGFPLALRIVAGRARARPDRSLNEIARRLSDDVSRLDELAAGDLAVRSTFDSSYRLLSDSAADAAAFRAFGVMPGPDTTPGPVAALLNQPLPQTESALDRLADAHMIEADPGDRYHPHDLVRDYATERSVEEDAPEDRLAAIERLTTWYLAAANAASRELNPHRSHVDLPIGPRAPLPTFHGYPDALAWLIAEQKNLTAVSALADTMRFDHLSWRFPIALWDLFSLSGHWPECIQAYLVGLGAARRIGDRPAQAWLLNNLAGACRQVGQPNEAIAHLTAALEINTMTGNLKAAGTNLYNIAVAHQSLGDLRTATARLTEALDIHQRVGHDYGIGMALSARGQIRAEAGDLTEAMADLKAAADIQRVGGDRFGVAATLAHLSETYRKTGQYAHAVALAQESFDLNRELGHTTGQGVALYQLGAALRCTDRHDEARTQWEHAARILTETGEDFADFVQSELNALAMPEPQPPDLSVDPNLRDSRSSSRPQSS